MQSQASHERCPAQRRPASPATTRAAEAATSPTVQRLAQTQAALNKRNAQGGLPASLKAGIEALSGIAMNDVRVHRNSSRPAQLQAHAYAQGTDIHLAPGQDHHLPHEAWHVVQQKQGRVRPTLQLADGVAVNDDAGLEREADTMGDAALGAVSLAAPQQNGLVQHVAQAHALQRASVNVRPATSKTLPGTISGITFGRRPSSNSRIQGQHLTAYVAFQSMILSHTVDQDIAGAAAALQELLPSIRAFINPDTTKTYLFDALGEVSTDLTAVIAEQMTGEHATAQKTLGRAIDKILSIRNKIPGSALATTNTGGHGEANPNGELWEMEKVFLRNGAPDPEWNQDEVARQAGEDMWKLMDANPVKGNDPEEVAAAMIKHIRQMMLSFPRVFAWLSTSPDWHLRPLLLLDNPKLPLAALSKAGRTQVTDIMELQGW